MPVALVARVTGIAGLSMAEALQKPTAPSRPWVVYGATLLPMPSWFPPSLLHQYLQFDALNPHATHQAPPHGEMNILPNELFKVQAARPVAGGEDNGRDLGWVEEMMGKGGVWEEILRENGLVETKLEEVTCFDALFHVLNFGFQHLCCMNKSREFEFLVYVNTLKSLKRWVGRYREMNILPKA